LTTDCDLFGDRVMAPETVATVRNGSHEVEGRASVNDRGAACLRPAFGMLRISDLYRQ